MRPLAALLEGLQVHGVNVESDENGELVEADQDGVLPEGFYSTTNFVTAVRLDGRWVTVERPEMDCAIVVTPGDARPGPSRCTGSGQETGLSSGCGECESNGPS